jgi:ribosome-binding factor A
MKARSFRDKRIAKLLFNEISLIINYELEDALLNEIIITDVVVTKDLGLARIFFRSLNNKMDIDRLKKEIDRNMGKISQKLSERIHIKKLPYLEFLVDDLYYNAEKIEEIIKQIHKDG